MKDPREIVREKLDEHRLNMAEVSKKLGKNRAYIHQYLTRNTPRQLPEDIRKSLARILHVEEIALRPGATADAAGKEKLTTSSHDSGVEDEPAMSEEEARILRVYRGLPTALKAMVESAFDNLERQGSEEPARRPFRDRA